MAAEATLTTQHTEALESQLAAIEGEVARYEHYFAESTAVTSSIAGSLTGVLQQLQTLQAPQVVSSSTSNLHPGMASHAPAGSGSGPNSAAAGRARGTDAPGGGHDAADAAASSLPEEPAAGSEAGASESTALLAAGGKPATPIVPASLDVVNKPPIELLRILEAQVNELLGWHFAVFGSRKNALGLGAAVLGSVSGGAGTGGNGLGGGLVGTAVGQPGGVNGGGSGSGSGAQGNGNESDLLAGHHGHAGGLLGMGPAPPITSLSILAPSVSDDHDANGEGDDADRPLTRAELVACAVRGLAKRAKAAPTTMRAQPTKDKRKGKPVV
ncbi:hypothetical protein CAUPRSCDRAFT_13269 [Caulochytrium protostelioides]|nr:hypothetical protein CAUPRSCDRAFT_13269 [Caulochytrium protostelioides]